ncbi:hypothetical protein D9758_018165 [Tetrapyrgos nigripes]|uniref:C2H2-type domain-containing protein n=1 Tax=Tetrapyrgos nigripes TaxID=182062 RepID=A0A8H5F948_9AGAR|nr:hypothetical protein D9758_018165 [Tetrapyrgos nigripes]
MPRRRLQVNQAYPCPFPRCGRSFADTSARNRHVSTGHRQMPTSGDGTPAPVNPEETAESPDDFLTHHDDVSPPPQPSPPTSKNYHPYLTGIPCDKDGNNIDPNTPPTPATASENPWEPFEDEVQFRLADFLFQKVEMSQGDIDYLMELWAMSMAERGAPFVNHQDMYRAIDNIQLGSAPWRCFKVPPSWYSTNGVDDSTVPEWKKQEYQVWYRDPEVVIAHILSNPDYKNDFNTTPYVEIGRDGKRRWSDFMSANMAWRHATQIYQDDPDTYGSMLLPIILGSDKTTVSVATGNVEYHPVYLSIGNLTNQARRAHRNGVVPIAFLAIPHGMPSIPPPDLPVFLTDISADRQYDNDAEFRNFKRQLYHSSLNSILRPLKQGMAKPVIRRCPDGHFRRVIYDLASYIADYPEQVLLSGIVSGWCAKCTALSSNLDGSNASRRCRQHTAAIFQELKDLNLNDFNSLLWDNWGIDASLIPFTQGFPRADIHEMITSDLLHQVIKGSFKDHLVEWVQEYLNATCHSAAEARQIMDDIDRRIAAVPPFPGLRRFPQGRRFKQWTGDDSKALMKVYLAAIAEYLPDEMVKCFAAFLDFCYLVRRVDFSETTLAEVQETLNRFHHYRVVFLQTGVRDDFNLPRQHAMMHYVQHIMEFGAPNGLCTSITESRHITAVKKPWRRSNRYNALSQMLLTIQQLDKLCALRSDLVAKHLLPLIHTTPEPFDQDDDEDEGAVDDKATAHVFLASTRERKYPRDIDALSHQVGHPGLAELTRRFLHEQLSACPADDVDVDDLPLISSKVYIHHSAIAYFSAPSDVSGIRGMRRERIRCTPSWYGYPRRDCAFVAQDQTLPGFYGLAVVRCLLFFSFTYEDVEYPCALVHWFNRHGSRPDPNTGMWVVKPDNRGRLEEPFISVLHIDTFVRCCHLLPKYGDNPVPDTFHFSYSLDAFTAFYVNKYIDHHANEIAF